MEFHATGKLVVKMASSLAMASDRFGMSCLISNERKKRHPLTILSIPVIMLEYACLYDRKPSDTRDISQY